MTGELHEGAIQLTTLPPSEREPDWPSTSLLTVRGKDHDLTVSDLRKLSKMCLRAAASLEKIKK
jgi:hypothetical protein